MAVVDLTSLGVAAVDVSTIEHDVINQVKQSKLDKLHFELQTIQSEISESKAEIKRVKS